MKSKNEEIFRDKLEELSKIKKEYATGYSRYSGIRAVLFLLSAGFILIGAFDGKNLMLVLGIVLFVLFCAIVAAHGKLVKKQAVCDSRIEVCQNYVSRYSEAWRDFSDDGSKYLELSDTVARDIDLLGPNSLYQFISVCHTTIGKKSLADVIKNGRNDNSELAEINSATEELGRKIDYSVEFEASGVRFQKQKRQVDIEKLQNISEINTDISVPVWMKICRFAIPVVMFVLILLVALKYVHYLVPVGTFIVFLSLSILTKSRSDEIIMPCYLAGHGLDDLIDMMRVISDEEFESKRLNSIKILVDNESGALLALKKLERLIQCFNIMYNPLLHQLLSGLVAWDYHIACKVEDWQKKYSKQVSKGIDGISEMEVLMSLSTLARIRETSYACVKNDSKCEVKCTDMYHPLILPDKVVENNAQISNGITIITGSNMSGKTTFLRTLAINLSLAYMGAPVCAGELSTNRMKMFTSMRITDDVVNGISTFYAEILRIKQMAEYRACNEPMICLVDEIFKGTNSADRIVGAKEAITKLSGENSIVVVSTHDFELCSIRDREDKEAVNYHFEEYYEDDKLKFDYKIRNGRCTTTNARAILKMAGF